MDNNIAALDNLRTSELVVATGTIAGVPTPACFTPSAGPAAAGAAVFSKFSWSNADVVAFGALQTGNVPLCTLPPRTYVTRAFLLLSTQASGVTTLTVSVGVQGPDYFDLITSSAAADALAAPGGLVGAMTDAVLPSMSAATPVFLQFNALTGAEKLADVLGSSGEVFLETVVLP